MSVMSRVNIGCPIWTHDAWFGNLYPPKKSKIAPLQAYAGLFNSVECNSSFYHLPSLETISKWRENVGADFRFMIKLPRTISHAGQLGTCHSQLKEALENIAHLGITLGGIMLQLPKQFSPMHLDQLSVFLEEVPSKVNVSVEVRHMAFFNKSAEEKALNQLLATHQADRVVMDTRALFACDPSQYSAAERTLITEVQAKKPRVPTHVIATGNAPIVRFVGHQNINQNAQYYQPWITKIKAWLDAGKNPSIFFHMPDNKDAPWLAAAFINDYNLTYPDQCLPTLTLPRRKDPATQPTSQQLSIF